MNLPCRPSLATTFGVFNSSLEKQATTVYHAPKRCFQFLKLIYHHYCMTNQNAQCLNKRCVVWQNCLLSPEWHYFLVEALRTTHGLGCSCDSENLHLNGILMRGVWIWAPGFQGLFACLRTGCGMVKPRCESCKLANSLWNFDRGCEYADRELISGVGMWIANWVRYGNTTVWILLTCELGSTDC